MVFYGTILPPTDVSHALTTSISQKNNKTTNINSENNLKSGECQVTATSCLGLLLFLSKMLIPDIL